MNRHGTALVMLGMVGATAAQTGSVVATVNGEQIGEAEYRARMEFLDTRELAQSVGSKIYSVPPGFQTILQLINERLVFQLAKEKGVTPSEPELRAELQSITAEEPKVLEAFTKSGRTAADFERQVRYELTKFKLQTFGITVTNLEVEKFYKENPTRFTLAKRFKLRVIALNDEAKKGAVDAELASGKAFAEVAKAHSVDVSRLSGGQFGTVPVVAMSPVLSKALQNVKVGQTTAWITEQGTHLKFLVEEILPEKLTPLDPQLQKTLRRQLMLDRGRVKNNVTKEILQARAKAKVEITNPWFNDLYKQVISEPTVGG